MLRLIIPPDGRESLRLLCLGAHSDDIEIGCGGTILRIAAEIPGLVVKWIVFSGDERRGTEARNSAAAVLEHVSEKQIEVLGFRDGYFPSQSADIKDYFEAVKRDFDPSLILTHWQNDAHQDHRLLAELTFNTFRNHLVLEYEIPKYDGDLGNPNFFVPLDGSTTPAEDRHHLTPLCKPARTKLVRELRLSSQWPGCAASDAMPLKEWPRRFTSGRSCFKSGRPECAAGCA